MSESQRLSGAIQEKIARLAKKGLSVRKIAADAGCSRDAVDKYMRGGIKTDPGKEPTFEGIRLLLKKGPKDAGELGRLLECSPSKVAHLIDANRKVGALVVDLVGGHYCLGDSINIEPGKVAVKANSKGEHRFGFITDTHLCSRFSRLDVLKAAYDHFEREGITRVYHAGNWIDGEARFNRTDLIVAPGMQSQIDYMIQEYPQRDGITTYYIDGDDHEGWYKQREGIEAGKFLQAEARIAGRKDLVYLGYAECDVSLRHGTGAAVMRIVHPGGGSAYAISYTDQKRVESYQGGEKPQVELVGHYHKFNFGYPREVWTLQGGTTSDQSMFMRKKRLQAHVGFCTATVYQGPDGIVTSFVPRFFPFFDRGYYEHRY